MNKIINKTENGPFILVTWTNRPNQADKVKDALRKDGFRFLMTVMEKQDCKNRGGQFSLQKIRTQLQEKLKGNDVLQLFIFWENLIHKATGKIVNEFSNLAEMDDRWNTNMEQVVAKLAKSVLGEHFDRLNLKEVIHNAMYSMNTTLADAIQQETDYPSGIPALGLSIPQIQRSGTATVADGTINSKLLLKQVIDNSPIPGNIYPNNIVKKASVEKLFSGWDQFTEKDKLLKKIKHIILEITPACDYAEKKALVSRLLPGVMWPHEYAKQVKHPADFSYKSPVLKDRDGNLFHFVFDFRTFTSVETNKLKPKKPIFAIQNELLADIQSKLSRHVSRLGVVSVE